VDASKNTSKREKTHQRGKKHIKEGKNTSKREKTYQRRKIYIKEGKNTSKRERLTRFVPFIRDRVNA